MRMSVRRKRPQQSEATTIPSSASSCCFLRLGIVVPDAGACAVCAHLGDCSRSFRPLRHKSGDDPARPWLRGRPYPLMNSSKVSLYLCTFCVVPVAMAFALALGAAGCAREPAWEEGRAGRCFELRCGPQGSAECLASTPTIDLALGQAVERSPRRRSSVAILPWERDDAVPGCAGDEACASRARCILGRCYAPPRSESEIRRWFKGESALAGSLPGWSVALRDAGQLGLRSSLAAEETALWAIYLGADWVTPQGHPVGADLKPVAFVPVRGHGQSLWAQRRPTLGEGGAVQLDLGPQWVPDSSWRWSLHCGQGRPQSLRVLDRSERGRVTLQSRAQSSWPSGPCRVLVKIPGHAAFASAWTSSDGGSRHRPGKPRHGAGDLAPGIYSGERHQG